MHISNFLSAHQDTVLWIFGYFMDFVIVAAVVGMVATFGVVQGPSPRPLSDKHAIPEGE